MANGMVPVELARAALLALSWALPGARAPLKLMAPAQHRRLLSASRQCQQQYLGLPDVPRHLWDELLSRAWYVVLSRTVTVSG